MTTFDYVTSITFMMRVYQISTLAVLLQLCAFGLAASLIAPNTSITTSLPTYNAAESLTLNLTMTTPRK